MPAFVIALAAFAGVLFALAGAFGGLRWWQVAPSDWFWRLLRTAQAAYLVFVAAAAIALLAGERPDDDLFYVYAPLPALVSFLGEQLRIGAAQAVLDARELPDAQAVGQLDAAGQRSVVVAILRREMGVMALAALMCAALLARVVL